jgi:hypothetical protein
MNCRPPHAAHVRISGGEGDVLVLVAEGLARRSNEFSTISSELAPIPSRHTAAPNAREPRQLQAEAGPSTGRISKPNGPANPMSRQSRYTVVPAKLRSFPAAVAEARFALWRRLPPRVAGVAGQQIPAARGSSRSIQGYPQLPEHKHQFVAVYLSLSSSPILSYEQSACSTYSNTTSRTMFRFVLETV